MEQNVFPGAVAELYHVLLLQLVISLWFNTVVVEEGTIGRSQVNNVGENPREKHK